MKLHFVKEENFNSEMKEFYMQQWPSANKEVFGFTEQSKWRMEEYLISARIHEEIIGVAQFRIIGGVGYLSTLLAKEEYRGKGVVGQSLLAKFESVAKENNCHKFGLKTYKDSRAYNFFKKQGYMEEGILLNDIHGIDWIMMAKFVKVG